MITVNELIAKLEKVKDKDKPVLFSTWDEDQIMLMFMNITKLFK